jgi:hypothetical protein
MFIFISGERERPEFFFGHVNVLLFRYDRRHVLFRGRTGNAVES